jgi:hypothetical protein
VSGGKTKNRSPVIYGQIIFLFADTSSLATVVKIILEFTSVFVKPGDAFHSADPYIMQGIFHDLFDHITADGFEAGLLTIVVYVKHAPVIHIQSVPGGYPEQTVLIFKNIIDGTVRQTIAVVELLNKKLLGSLGIAAICCGLQD